MFSGKFAVYQTDTGTEITYKMILRKVKMITGKSKQQIPEVINIHSGLLMNKQRQQNTFIPSLQAVVRSHAGSLLSKSPISQVERKTIAPPMHDF